MNLSLSLNSVRSSIWPWTPHPLQEEFFGNNFCVRMNVSYEFAVSPAVLGQAIVRWDQYCLGFCLRHHAFVYLHRLVLSFGSFYIKRKRLEEWNNFFPEFFFYFIFRLYLNYKEKHGKRFCVFSIAVTITYVSSLNDGKDTKNYYSSSRLNENKVPVWHQHSASSDRWSASGKHGGLRKKKSWIRYPSVCLSFRSASGYNLQNSNFRDVLSGLHYLTKRQTDRRWRPYWIFRISP